MQGSIKLWFLGLSTAFATFCICVAYTLFAVEGEIDNLDELDAWMLEESQQLRALIPALQPIHSDKGDHLIYSGQSPFDRNVPSSGDKQK